MRFVFLSPLSLVPSAARVYGFLGSSATVGARRFSHYISFGMNLLLLGGLCIYLYSCAKSRERALESKYGPFVTCCLAMALIMADETRHVLQHAAIWRAPSSSQYREDCAAGIESFVCLSVVGWLFTVVFTYTGFLLLFTATMWNARICGKIGDIRDKWREIRSAPSSATSDNSAAAAAASRATFPSASASINSSQPDLSGLAVAVNSDAAVHHSSSSSHFVVGDSAAADDVGLDLAIAEGDEAAASPMPTHAGSHASWRKESVGLDKL